MHVCVIDVLRDATNLIHPETFQDIKIRIVRTIFIGPVPIYDYGAQRYIRKIIQENLSGQYKNEKEKKIMRGKER